MSEEPPAPDARDGEGGYDFSVPPVSGWGRLLSGAETLVYELNERGHWLFGLYDRANELWARLAFRGVRERASRLDQAIEGRGVTVRMRMLSAADLDAFAALLRELGDHKYVPPHALDRAAARSALSRASYLPFGIFDGERLVGYWLLRLFFPRRAVTGVWMLGAYFSAGLARLGISVTGAFTDREGFDNYITVPLDNVASLKPSLAAGWRIVRRNERFYVLLRRPQPDRDGA